MSEWKYNLRWRTNFEGLETLGWTAGIAATIGVNTLFNMPSLPCYLSVAVQAAYGIRSLPAAWDIYTHKRRLKRKPKPLVMDMKSFIEQMIREPDSYLICRGFEWGQNEGQLASELIKRDIK
ncbi:DNA transfer protein, partial [Citrobacter freundii]